MFLGACLSGVEVVEGFVGVVLDPGGIGAFAVSHVGVLVGGCDHALEDVAAFLGGVGVVGDFGDEVGPGGFGGHLLFPCLVALRFALTQIV